MSDIGHALSKHSGSFHGLVPLNGAIIPVIHLRSLLVLTPTEPEEIFHSVATGLSGV
jgi:chemotaxis signal transduction protein